MIILSSDSKRIVNVGAKDIMFSLYSTIVLRVDGTGIEKAIGFLQSGECNSADALECARQFNLVRDRLSQILPENSVYDMRHPENKAPWLGNLSPTITSCANMFITADGKDLLFELVSILTYSYYAKVSVSIT